MTTEECAICGDDVPFGTTAHVLLNPKHVEGVSDHYVCRPCYDEHLAGLFAASEGEEGNVEGRDEDGEEESVEEHDEDDEGALDGDDRDADADAEQLEPV